jgi:hypothetical protein
MTALAPLHAPRAPAPTPAVAGSGSRATAHGPSAARGHRLAALAGGGYLAHQHRFGPGRRELRDLRRQHAGLAHAEKGSRQALLRDILGEGLGQMDRTELSPLAVFSGGGEATRQGRRGRYRVRLQPDIGDPVKRRSYLLHELIHVASDRNYSSNAQEGREFYNVGEGPNLDPSRHHFHPQYEPTRQRALEVYDLASNDEHLDPYHRAHIQERMGYIENKPFQERDTVVSDLLYYAHSYGIPEESPTHQAIVQWAREAYHQRRPKSD